MHELALVQKIVEDVTRVAMKAGLKNVVTLRMRVGKMAGFAPDQLSFLFETYEKDPCLESTRLEIKEIPVELECPECKHLFTDERFDDYSFAHSISHAPRAYIAPPCPKCNANGPQIIKGRELELVNLEGE